MSGRRVVITTISSTMFGYLMRGRRDAAITSDWPEDAVIVGGEFNLEHSVVRLMIESTAFDEIPEASLVPEWTPTFTAYMVDPPAHALIAMIEKMQEEEISDAVGAIP